MHSGLTCARVFALVVGCATAEMVLAQSDADLLTRRVLKAPEVISGVMCGETRGASAAFYPSGALESCPLARDTALGWHRLSAGTWIYLTEAGELRRAWLPRDTWLDGHVCRGTGYKGWSVEFHENGRLSVCFLARVEEIDGVPCEKGTFWKELRGSTMVRLSDAGVLRQCKAARDFTLDGIRYRKGQRVRR
jgi:hypothetical protein